MGASKTTENKGEYEAPAGQGGGIVKKWAHKIRCFLGCHRVVWEEDGLHCVDCDFFKSKAEHMVDLHAGGGW